ncbi:MAG: acyl-CoA thioesterase [Pseudomonadales bacterium]
MDKRIVPEKYSGLRTVLAEHIDGLGHVNNIRYINWCEELAWQHSEQLGLSVDDYQRLDRAMAVYHAEFDYRAPAFEGQTLRVSTWLSFAKGTRMTRCFEIIRNDNAQVLMTGVWQLSCIEISSGKPKRFPEEFVDVYLPEVISSSASVHEKSG